MKTLKNALLSQSNWEWKKLEDVCNLIRGFSFDSNKYKTKGNPIVKVLNVQEGEIVKEDLVYFEESDYPRDLSRYLLKAGEVCITTSGASSGKIAINRHDHSFHISSTVCKLETLDQINPLYLFFCLDSFQDEIHQLVRGGAVKGLPIKDFQKINIPIPSLEIQKQISEFLDLLRELVRELSTELVLS